VVAGGRLSTHKRLFAVRASDGSVCPRSCENALCVRSVFPGRDCGDADWSIGACGEGSDQVLIAAISGATPRIVIIRFRL
jgi:hypothetical protein